MDSGDPRALAVRTEWLVKRFGRETALAGINLAVPEGSVYLLAGTNGAGKSTLLRTLLNLERADHGTSQVLGLDTRTGGPAIRARIGVCPQEDTLDAELNVFENLFIYGRYFGLPKAVVRSGRGSCWSSPSSPTRPTRASRSSPAA